MKEYEKNDQIGTREEFSAGNGAACAVKKEGIQGRAAASYVAKIGMFSALAFVLYLLKFPMPFIFPVWLELHFSDIAAVIAGFALGPVAGCAVAVLRVVLKLIVMGTSTGFIGELGDVLIGLSFTLPASLIYKYNRTRRGAMIGLLAGAIGSVTGAIISNRFLLIPFYGNLMGMNALVGMMKGLFGGITVNNFYAYYLWLSVLPFNIFRVIVIDIVTLFAYKHISRLLGKF